MFKYTKTKSPDGIRNWILAFGNYLFFGVCYLFFPAISDETNQQRSMTGK